MAMLDAREFDEEFGLFLRKEVFGIDCETNEVKVISLFGKQDAVKHELEGLNCWSVDMCNNMKTKDQGIYCVNWQDSETAGRSLVLFGWIQDSLFKNARLRDTVTYVLRFLTCLSPDMVCCLSPKDVERLVVSMSSNNSGAYKSFSGIQEEQKNVVRCECLSDVSLSVTSSIQNVQLLKGSYPSFVVIEPAPAKKSVESYNKSFDNMNKFARWLSDESRQRNLNFEFGRTDSNHFCNGLLQAAGRWPNAKLKDVRGMLAQSLETSADITVDQVQMYMKERRARLLGSIDKLFDLDVLFTAANSEPAFVTVHSYMEEVQATKDIWSKIDCAAQKTLNLPLRLKNQIKFIALTFRDQLASNSKCEARESLAKYMQEFTASDGKLSACGVGVVERKWKSFYIECYPGSNLLSNQFRECMTEPLNEARQALGRGSGGCL